MSLRDVTIYFARPLLISAGVLVFMLAGFGPHAFLTTGLLALLETSLSFDNAIVNARVLENMPLLWRKRFLTWGIAFAVVGTRLILPILVVSIVAGISPILVAHTALWDAVGYAKLLATTHHTINAFGTAFLAMVALNYFFDEEKQVHWIDRLERQIAHWGNIARIEILLVLILLVIAALLSGGNGTTIMVAGVVGIILHIVMDTLVKGMSHSAAHLTKSGIVGFVYLNVLDSAFSLDGVIGAFALTTDVIVIAIGLGIGAYFVRTMTVYIVENRTLSTLRYLEHGAHWAILGLALCMATSLIVPVPEYVTACVGFAFIAASYRSSRRFVS